MAAGGYCGWNYIRTPVLVITKGEVEMAAEYTVLKIDEMTRLADTGGTEHYYRHRIKTKGGVLLTVEVSEKDFTAEKAAPILAKAATEADKILKL